MEIKMIKYLLLRSGTVFKSYCVISGISMQYKMFI